MRTGNYKNQLKGNLRYTAFIPSKLPLELRFDVELQTLLSKADQAL